MLPILSRPEDRQCAPSDIALLEISIWIVKVKVKVEVKAPVVIRRALLAATSMRLRRE